MLKDQNSSRSDSFTVFQRAPKEENAWFKKISPPVSDGEASIPIFRTQIPEVATGLKDRGLKSVHESGWSRW